MDKNLYNSMNHEEFKMNLIDNSNFENGRKSLVFLARKIQY